MTPTNGPSGGLGVVRPGSPSAKTFPRAGSPNHQDDSKETPILAPNPLVSAFLIGGMFGQGKGSVCWLGCLR